MKDVDVRGKNGFVGNFFFSIRFNSSKSSYTALIYLVYSVQLSRRFEVFDGDRYMN